MGVWNMHKDFKAQLCYIFDKYSTAGSAWNCLLQLGCRSSWQLDLPSLPRAESWNLWARLISLEFVVKVTVVGYLNSKGLVGLYILWNNPTKVVTRTWLCNWIVAVRSSSICYPLSRVRGLEFKVIGKSV